MCVLFVLFFFLGGGGVVGIFVFYYYFLLFCLGRGALGGFGFVCGVWGCFFVVGRGGGG